MIKIYRLPRTARLNNDKAIAALGANSHPLRGRWFTVRRARSAVGHARVAVRVGKKVMKTAVARNRIRRLVRETFRLQRSKLQARDFLVSVRADLTDIALSEARHDLERLLSRT